MPRIALDLNKKEDQQKVRGQWRVGPGYVPGQPNEGLTAGIEGSPARCSVDRPAPNAPQPRGERGTIWQSPWIERTGTTGP